MISLNSNSLKPLFNLMRHFDKDTYALLRYSLILIVASSIFDLLSIASLVPLLGYFLLQSEYPNATNFSFTYSPSLLIVAFITIVIISAFARSYNVYLIQKTAGSIGLRLGAKLLHGLLGMPYQWHLHHNSSSLIALNTEIETKVILSYTFLLQLTYAVFTAILVVMALLFYNASLTLSLVALLLPAYYLLTLYSKKKTRSNSKHVLASTKKILRTLREAYSSLRDIFIYNKSLIFLKEFSAADSLSRNLYAENEFLASFPRYALEAVCIIVVISYVFLSINSGSSATDIIPLVGAFVFGLQKLMPVLQMISTSYTRINSYSSDIAEYSIMMDKFPPCSLPEYSSSTGQYPRSNLSFDLIRLDNISFAYGASMPPVFTSLCLEISSNDRLALKGSSGSGKSTLLDVLTGLLSPTSGQILLFKDSNLIGSVDQLRSSWSSSIAYVSQSTFILDATIAENIAFGIDLEHIDFDRLRLAAYLANCDLFIEQLKESYLSSIGEVGSRFSGGQLQRIGIARALYLNFSLLILDESTSALDEESENIVLTRIFTHYANIPIIITSHRKNTLSYCNKILDLSSP